MTELQFDPMRETPPPVGTTKSGRGFWFLTAAIVLAICLGCWLFLYPRRPVETRATADARGSSTSEPSPPPIAGPSPPPDSTPGIPALAQSDAFVRSLAAEIFGSSALDGWLAGGDDLVQRGVRAILAIAERRSTRRFLEFLPFEGPFETSVRGGERIISTESYHRYDRLVDLFVGLDGERLARFAEKLEPLLSQAMDENAFPGTGFEATLKSAIDHLLATPSPQGELAVSAGEDGLYRFADPRLEALTPPQKQLLRLGPGNGARVRAKLAELRLALGVAAPTE